MTHVTAGQLLARCAFPPAGTEVVCAVSGGPDSLALLALAVEAGCEVTAVHVDHGLRPDSGTDGEIVRAAAQRFGAELEMVAVGVEPGPNLESRARAARYASLPAGALTGHTADDQAETILLNVLRGSGLHGLAGIRAGDGRRPLLGLRRNETHALCASLGLAVVTDPTNVDPAFRRNRVRHELLPLLDDIAERDVVPLLCRLGRIAEESGDHLDAVASSLDATDVGALRAAPPLLAGLAVRRWLTSVDPERHPPDRATVDRVLGVVSGGATATDVGGGWQVRRRAGQLRLVRSGDSSGDLSATGPGRGA
jgi:tRNA(Ile)-lysidine synthase